MFDALLRPLIDPPLNRAGRVAAGLGLSANAVTLTGMAIGIAAGFAIAHGHFAAGLALIIVNRLCDGVDGAIARATHKSDFGGYLDIVCDFVFYVSVPLGFGWAAGANALPALVLVAAFTLTGTSFLAYAILAEKAGATTSAHGEKSFFYNTGLAEGAETIAVFVAMTLFPAWFAPIAYGYAALCTLTVVQRTLGVRRAFRS
jgi:phosphatidylglycerophosphate synthase